MPRRPNATTSLLSISIFGLLGFLYIVQNSIAKSEKENAKGSS
jgi:hypothetical protein